jgi:hypothetical protein
VPSGTTRHNSANAGDDELRRDDVARMWKAKGYTRLFVTEPLFADARARLLCVAKAT